MFYRDVTEVYSYKKMNNFEHKETLFKTINNQLFKSHFKQTI